MLVLNNISIFNFKQR